MSDNKKAPEERDLTIMETIKSMGITDWVMTGVVVAAMVVFLGTIIGIW